MCHIIIGLQEPTNALGQVDEQEDLGLVEASCPGCPVSDSSTPAPAGGSFRKQRKKWSARQTQAEQGGAPKQKNKVRHRSFCRNKVRQGHLDLPWLCHELKGGCGLTLPATAFSCSCGIWRCRNPQCNEINSSERCLVCKTPSSLSSRVGKAEGRSPAAQLNAHESVGINFQLEVQVRLLLAL